MRTASTSSSGVLYRCGRRQSPAHMKVAPASACRSWIVVSLRGVRRHPASVASSTGTQGARAVVGFVSANDEPTAREQSRWEASMQALPWQGPIVIVVYRLRSSIESNPSTTAAFSSLLVTSMQRHATCLPAPRPDSGGSTTGSSSAAASARSRSIRSPEASIA